MFNLSSTVQSSPVQNLIRGAVLVEGGSFQVAYDPKITGSYGYYVCKQCERGCADSWGFPHLKTCPTIENTDKDFRKKSMIYVFGENDNNLISSFKKEYIEKIKELAKSKL